MQLISSIFDFDNVLISSIFLDYAMPLMREFRYRSSAFSLLSLRLLLFLLKKWTILFSFTNFVMILQVLFSYIPNFLDLFLLKNSHASEFSINISLRIFQIFTRNSIFIQNYWKFSTMTIQRKTRQSKNSRNGQRDYQQIRKRRNRHLYR